MQSIHDILGSHGPLAKQVSGFAARAEQQAMAEAVADALEQHSSLIVEAGTGTGKTFAYLVPALLSGQKIIISTGTKNLQDQLYHRDLPVVRQALSVPVSVALLKGRSNYLCLHRLNLAEEGHYSSPAMAKKVQRIRRWAGQTQNGDVAELSTLSENDPIWARVTSNADNCLGQECPSFDNCHLINARRAAQAADVVVVNHHLLFADMALREEGFGELLPSAEAFIIDEAHQLPDVASNFFGSAISSNQLQELARDAIDEYIQEINEDKQLQTCAEKLQKALQDLRLALGSGLRKAAWMEVKNTPAVTDEIAEVSELLVQLQQLLKPLAERSKGLDSCYRRAVELQHRFENLTRQSPEDHIHWFETHKRSFTIHLTPLNIADCFQEKIGASKAAWIFTSATLAVADSFEHFSSTLGLNDARTARWESPFDFAEQGLFYVPKNLPEPNSSGYTRAVVDAALPVLRASQGRAFLLFTSHRALNEAADYLHDSLPYTLMVQGDEPRDILLERFRQSGNAILLGTSSFWEGVDVRGEALSCVIIDKLPFASPGDPVLQARIDALRKRGINAFMDYQLPAAVITLKQGAGRLIRDVTDRGVLMICDPRLLSKPYGRVFINSMPPMQRTRELSKIESFFAVEQRDAS